MASSSRTKKRKDSVAFDKNIFVDEEAQNKYFESIVNRVLIAGRGFLITPSEYPKIWNMIQQRGWGAFTAQPKPAIVPLVREFYANAYTHEDKRVFVRGKQVNFSARAINRIFKLPEIERDEYSSFIDGEIDYQEVIRTLTVPGTQWKMTGNRPITFKSLGLHRECKAWYYFQGARLMPARHFSDVTREKAVLLYGLVSGKSLDVGRFVSSNIVTCINNQSMSLCYPSLITALCVAAEVQYSEHEESLLPMAALTDSRIYGMKHVDNMGAIIEVPRPRPQPSHTLTLAERLERVEDRVREQGEQFQTFQSSQYNCNNAMAAMMRQLAIGMAVDMSQFPVMPSYPGHADQEMSGSSQAEVGDGVGDEGGDGDGDGDGADF